jgi:Gas vesicle synthesis protein GvpL/GvpF
VTTEPSHQRLCTALKELGASDVEELVREAHEQARERVLALLTDAMTQATLDRVCDLLSGAPNANLRPRVDEQPAATGNATDLGWYVYGVVCAGGATLPDLPGVDSQYQTSVLEQGELAAVVSRVVLEDFGEEPLREHLSDLEWLEQTARAHESVLEAVGAERTLIPMRMCTVYRSESGVLEMLGREAGALAAALEQLDQKAEWGVKVFAGRDSAASLVTTGGDSPESRSGTDYMRDRRDQRDEQHRLDGRIETAGQEIHRRLSTIAVDAQVAAPQRPEVSGHAGDMVLNGVYLVHDDDRGRFSSAVDALAAEFAVLGLDLVLTGPWPAYNFVPGTIGAAW